MELQINKNQYGYQSKSTPIVCRHCNKDSGHTVEGFMFMVVAVAIRCMGCGKIIIPAPPIVLNKTNFYLEKIYE